MKKLRVSLACFFLASQYIMATVSAAPDSPESNQTEGRATIGEPEGSAVVGSVSSVCSGMILLLRIRYNAMMYPVYIDERCQL